MISRSYNYDPRHYRFQRGHTGHLEPSQPLVSYGREIGRLIGIAASVALLWALLACLT